MRNMKNIKIDKVFLAITTLLILTGLFVFTSASFGLISRKGFSLQDIFFDQVVMGVFLGIAVLFLAIKLPLKKLSTYALHFFIGAIILNLLVFAPIIGFEYNGASRWLNLGFISIQPSEFLKLATVIYFATLLPLFKDRIKTVRYSVGLAIVVLAVPAGILFAQKDTGTFMVIFFAVSAMLVAGGAKLRHFFLIILVSVIAIGVLAMVRPHVKDRILTFFDSSRDPQGSGYQIQKSLTTIGSGGITGRGFGQSIQKFGSLPEPTGDSIFAVVGEEFGFVGASAIILMFLLLGIRGLHIARKAPDMFGGLLAVGIVILILSQSFANIAAMLGLIPLTGVPLVFISHGGTALFFAFLEIGILLNISKVSPNKK